ncbi:MAG: hypothetical protein ABIH72_02270 [archaeon]
MAEVGFSTGSLYNTIIPFELRPSYYRKLGANALELSFPDEDSILGFKLYNEFVKDVLEFDFISVHAPWMSIVYDSDGESERVLSRLEDICSVFLVNGVVFHPDTVDDFELLENRDFRPLIENLDIRKQLVTTPEYFDEILGEFDIGAIIDLQHCYEHDPSMKLALELYAAMAGKLSHIHVSGCSEGNYHSLLIEAEKNSEVISSALNYMNVPKIIEGVVLDEEAEDIAYSVRKELELVRSYEK